MKQQYRFLLIGVLGLAFVAAFTLTGGQQAGPEGTLSLQAPAFVRAAEGNSPVVSTQIAAQLADEAGISAYMQTSSAISLNLVRGEFRTIETETADYIIGSVLVTDYPEEFDVHVYVHTDGWILAYYMNDEPTSKMADVKGDTVSTTNLETVIVIIANAAGEPVAGVQYYDFRFPNATDVLMVGENDDDEAYFTIELPSDFGYYERSWAVYDPNGALNFKIDGSFAPTVWRDLPLAYGTIPSSMLLSGTPHDIDLASTNYGALVITYRVP